jgi:hypothetical protein
MSQEFAKKQGRQGKQKTGQYDNKTDNDKLNLNDLFVLDYNTSLKIHVVAIQNNAIMYLIIT